MNALSFFAQGHPKGQPRPKAFARKFGDTYSARVYDPGTAENWKSQIADAFRRAYPTFDAFTGTVELRIIFYMPRPKSHFRSNGEIKPKAPEFCETKPDLDNLEKAVMDCLTQLMVWRDDSQVCLKITTKIYQNLNGFSSLAGAQIEVRAIEREAAQ